MRDDGVGDVGGSEQLDVDDGAWSRESVCGWWWLLVQQETSIQGMQEDYGRKLSFFGPTMKTPAGAVDPLELC